MKNALCNRPTGTPAGNTIVRVETEYFRGYGIVKEVIEHTVPNTPIQHINYNVLLLNGSNDTLVSVLADEIAEIDTTDTIELAKYLLSTYKHEQYTTLVRCLNHLYGCTNIELQYHESNKGIYFKATKSKYSIALGIDYNGNTIRKTKDFTLVSTENIFL